MQDSTQADSATSVFAPVREALHEADEDLKAAESLAHDGGDAPSGALTSSIAAVRLQVIDLLEYVSLIEWATAVCLIADELAVAVARLRANDRSSALVALEAGARSLARIDPPAEASALHESFVRAVTQAVDELRAAAPSDGGWNAGDAASAIERMQGTLDEATASASLRTRLVIRQFRSCGLLLAD